MCPMRKISWIKQAQKEFLKFPKGARIQVETALVIAAQGEKADISKPLQGFGSGLFEIALQYQTNAFRTVYALKLDEDIWVIHAFQKKSKQGVKTPKQDLDLIKERIKLLKRVL